MHTMMRFVFDRYLSLHQTPWIIQLMCVSVVVEFQLAMQFSMGWFSALRLSARRGKCLTRRILEQPAGWLTNPSAHSCTTWAGKPKSSLRLLSRMAYNVSGVRTRIASKRRLMQQTYLPQQQQFAPTNTKVPLQTSRTKASPAAPS